MKQFKATPICTVSVSVYPFFLAFEKINWRIPEPFPAGSPIFFQTKSSLSFILYIDFSLFIWYPLLNFVLRFTFNPLRSLSIFYFYFCQHFNLRVTESFFSLSSYLLSNETQFPLSKGAVFKFMHFPELNSTCA